MKFHQLARHNQLFPHQRAVSPIEHVQPMQQQQQQHQQQLANNSGQLTDDEDEDFTSENPVSIYDSLIAEQHQLSSRASGVMNNNNNNNNNNNEQQVNNQTTTALDSSSGFLMDKNKKLFPQKLWELIHNPSIQHCLRWSQDGQRVYLNRNEFETYYLKTPNNQFHTQKAISFVRQMNMYGFRKVDDCYYENDNFRRDQQHLLKNMIRRHPNKGLFVGLDHHQLAAAAAAQQALQVNHQLQQLEHQHKHRAEQALRLNNYLNSHQFHHHHHQQQQQQQRQHNNSNHQTNLAHQHQHSQQLEHSSLPFEQMSSQLAQAAVNHLSQQQQTLAQHQRLAENQTTATTIDQAHQLNGKIENLTQNARSSAAVSNHNPFNHQPKKSRLLNDFYASSNNNIGSANSNNDNVTTNNNNNDNQLISSQDSMHSTGSADTPPSQCSSSVNSGSAGSPQPSLSKVHNNPKQTIKTGRVITDQNYNKFNGNIVRQSEQSIQQQALMATDLTSQSLAARQAALHQTLVRSLLQLKHGSQHNLVHNNHHHHHHLHHDNHLHHHHQNRPQDLIATIQQQQQQRDSRTLLESLASLSSAGTGSIVDPASNSPTERTITPPSGINSPTSALDVVNCEDIGRYNGEDDDSGENLIALNLAKSSPDDRRMSQQHLTMNELANSDDKHLTINDDGEDVDDDEDDKKMMAADDSSGVNGDSSPLDAAKKFRKFLEDHMIHNVHNGTIDEDLDNKNGDLKIKQEVDGDEEDKLDDSDDLHHQRKRIKLFNKDDDEKAELDIDSSMRTLISLICKRRGNCLLNVAALNEAARYTERFLDTLLDDASLIANNLPQVDENMITADYGEVGNMKDFPIESKVDGAIDASSLSLALKLMPSKLLDAIKQQQVTCQSSDHRKLDD